MGVMECSRKGCNNIMCGHYSNRFGYICHECLSELKEKKEAVGLSIAQFMASDKKDNFNPDDDIDIEFTSRHS